MRSLIQTVFGVALLAVFFGLTGCSTDKREHVKWYDSDANRAKPAGTERTQQPASTAVADKRDNNANDFVAPKAPEEASITKSYDPNGTLTELRNFDGDPSVKYVLVRTTGDGLKQGVIGGSDGRITPIPANMVNSAMSASPNELAAALKTEPSKNDSAVPTSTQPAVAEQKTSQTTGTQTASSIPAKAVDLQQTKQSQPAVVFDQLPKRKG